MFKNLVATLHDAEGATTNEYSIMVALVVVVCMVLVTTLVKSPVGVQRHAGNVKIINSEVGDFGPTQPEAKSYGRYTYVMLSPAHPDRAKGFLDDLFASTVPQGQSGTPRASLNLFEVPVKTSMHGQPSLKEYNFGRAQGILDLVCITQSPKYVKICKTSRTVGPYLLTYAHPIGSQNAITAPYLVVDLSGVRISAFPYFIDRMKEQVQSPNISDSSRIYSFRGYLLNWLMGFSDIEPKIKTGIIDLVPKKASP